MNDLDKYINKRMRIDPEFTEGFDSGYTKFKLGYLLAKTREESGISQEELAQKLNLSELIINQIENDLQDISMSILEKYAQILGKKLLIQLK
ncbi:MAG: helix-turn-helix transcriptional regulator [Cyanobacteria bacterium]|nr:helix-turn-helix transcriptional regulator [Cyanobacteria bacterium CG_2015-16_32_12]NCO79454.1 helix-turn-helix transcriptional regulator [Cyanobacteria bacterium CG_2015-22_32_23]NCQ03966.1 helix-turn-helix transcriptional regulator [Cyanobacteria bacterium CG_2015-09_32_10]NCQ41467.1 helix-turn-helix transcriptional regulator [Cyanobacteria bacterium CG_2015-04_32_10]NCS84295.1 helix-turn-helix transcriptional regulator [Cyanobacteria bacterium CG_2015-02_32_10]